MFRSGLSIASEAAGSIILTTAFLIVMAEEIPIFPKQLQKISYFLARIRLARNVFTCAVLIILSLATSLGIVSSANNSKETVQKNHVYLIITSPNPFITTPKQFTLK